MYKKLFEYYSRRNNVFLVQDADGDVFIQKTFYNEVDFDNELKWYEFFAESRFLPKLINIDKASKTIIIEYIGSTNLLDQLTEFETVQDFDGASKLLNELFMFYKKFYSFALRKGLEVCFKDVNFRNFIIGNNKLYAIDLEQVCEGEKINDIGNIIAYLISYEPKYTTFKLNLAEGLLDLFLKEFKLNKQEVVANILHKQEEIVVKRSNLV